MWHQYYTITDSNHSTARMSINKEKEKKILTLSPTIQPHLHCLSSTTFITSSYAPQSLPMLPIAYSSRHSSSFFLQQLVYQRSKIKLNQSKSLRWVNFQIYNFFKKKFVLEIQYVNATIIKSNKDKITRNFQRPHMPPIPCSIRTHSFAYFSITRQSLSLNWVDFCPHQTKMFYLHH